jgi:diketogulonate reductase-like aldo/keto reductase
MPQKRDIVNEKLQLDLCLTNLVNLYYMKTVKLASGYTMPLLGLGTWMLRGEECKRAVKKAIELGYTHIDTAWMYGNQREIGDAIRENGTERSKLFITSKIWHDHLKYDAVLDQCEECLEQLRTDYLDLLLIHWPSAAVPLEETLAAFKKIYDQGKAKSLGVSNFNIALVERAREVSSVPISVNQVRYHVRYNPEELLEHCRKHQIALTAYSPLGRGEILHDPTLKAIAEKHGKTPAQVALIWLIQKGICVIPKASSEAHLRQNMSLFDWELTRQEMQQINGLSR